MTKEKWIEICKEMAPHLRALELIAKNNALDIVTIALGTETTGNAVWIEDDTGSHYRCVSDGDNDFKAEIGNMKTYSESCHRFTLTGKAPAAGKQSGAQK